ncbi:MAG: hypothetical protein FJ116_07365 [Deltaproteobacteria bacterium]|nr:hypothetical protein [Deltaproteobacteria bacterium]
MTDSNEISSQLSATFRELLGKLFNDPFAIQSGFLELSFEEIGLILEEPLEDNSQLLETYQSCKSIYCLLLIELDLCGYTSLPKELSERPLKDLFCLLETPKPVEPISVGETKAQEIIKDLNLEIDEQSVTNLNPLLETISSLSLDEALPVESTPEPSETLVVENASSLANSSPELEIIASTSSEENSVPHFEAETKFQNPGDILDLSSAYKNIAYFLKDKRDSRVLNTSNEAAQRVAIHCLICASEAKVFNLLKEPLSQIWPTRQQKIETLLIQGQFKFNEITNAKIDSDEKEFSSFLFEGKFPRLAALHCLKYLTLTQTLECLHPSVFELAAFLYFWGPQILGAGPLSLEATNPKLNGLNTTELAFRLFRLDRIKAHSNNFNRPLTESYLEQVIDDVEELVTLDLNKRSEHQKQVA